jgi:beta-glucosidase/6-phospho-beta-glucosidase/beta-galactosidase/ABC-type amino acid transport substrate-binding protein
MNFPNPLQRLRPSLDPLPEDFIFGVANADHQVEAFEQKYEDIRDVWDRRKKLTERGRATDFWNRYAEDIELARALGCKAFRFSIAWARVEPEPGKFDDEAFAHYHDIIKAIRDAGMEPMVTLHHFTWPIHVESRGGMIGGNFPAMYANYAKEAATRLGQDVRYWITFNEPSLLVLGYIKPWFESSFYFPPGMPTETTMSDQIAAVHKLIRNLFLAHSAARSVIKAVNPEAMVGANPAMLGLPLWAQKLLNWNAARIRTYEDWAKKERRFAERSLLEQGAVDMLIATLTMTPDRAEQMDFSHVYYSAGQTLMVKADSVITGPADLGRKNVAVVTSSTAQSAVHTLIFHANVKEVDSYPAALKALDAGEVDAILSDDTILRGFIMQNPGKYKLVGGKLTQEPYGVAVAKGNPELSDAVNNAVLYYLETGEWAASYSKHFPGEPVPPLPESSLQATVSDISGLAKASTRKAMNSVMSSVGVVMVQDRQTQKLGLPPAPRRSLLRRIQKRGHLVVGVKEDVPGFGYRNPRTGKWSGLEIDLARAIARYIFGDPGKVVFRPATTKERIPLLRSFLRIFDPIQKLYSIVSSAFITNWWYLGMAGKMPDFICPAECVGQQDFVGFDYYWGIGTLGLGGIKRLLDALAFGRFDNAPVWSHGLYALIKYHSELFPDKEIFIIENGSVDIADNVGRAEYVRKHIRELQRARKEGAKVKGYMYWSITSNREWGLKFTKSSDFGLYHVELDSDPGLKRVETDAVQAYKKIIAERGAS